MPPHRASTSLSRTFSLFSSSPRSRPNPQAILGNRPFSISTTQAYASSKATSNPNPQHDAQEDRNKMNTEHNEYSKSGTDSAAAGNEEAAFDPKITDPQEAKDKAGQGNKVNPLDASPANPEISKGTREQKDG